MTLTALGRAEPTAPLDGTRSTPAVRLCVVSLERTTLPGQALSDTDRCRPQQFRRLRCALLTSWELLAHIASVELLVTELLTNALQHGEGPEVDVMISALQTPVLRQPFTLTTLPWFTPGHLVRTTRRRSRSARAHPLRVTAASVPAQAGARSMRARGPPHRKQSPSPPGGRSGPRWARGSDAPNDTESVRGGCHPHGRHLPR